MAAWSLAMIRPLIIALLVILVWVLLLKLFGKRRALDWNGVVFAIGFIALAFYLRHVTGIGWPGPISG